MPEGQIFSLRGKTVIQLGGSGTLGRALVSALACAGATLIVASRQRAALAAVAAAERAAGHDVQAEEVDITSEVSLMALRDHVLARHQTVDGLVINAVSRPMQAFTDNLRAWETSMATNATGLFSILRLFGDVMAGQQVGSIVNIASIQGMVGPNPWLYEGTAMQSPPDYFFHKGGMINITRYLAAYYGNSGVRVNVVSPGGIRNPERPPPTSFLERYGKMTALGRMAEPHEIGGAVIFLLSDASKYITGVNLPIDGGYTAR